VTLDNDGESIDDRRLANLPAPAISWVPLSGLSGPCCSRDSGTNGSALSARPAPSDVAVGTNSESLFIGLAQLPYFNLRVARLQYLVVTKVPTGTLHRQTRARFGSNWAFLATREIQTQRFQGIAEMVTGKQYRARQHCSFHQRKPAIPTLTPAITRCWVMSRP
jgi:hypothetical protein